MKAYAKTPSPLVLKRTTRETQITLTYPVAALGVSTGLAMLDHLLTALFNYWDLPVCLEAKGDLDIDAHHTTEDIGYVIGRLILRLQDTLEAHGQSPCRFGEVHQVMDDALVWLAADLGGRCYVDIRGFETLELSGGLLTWEMLEELILALTRESGLALHGQWQRGTKAHHGAEALFKALGRLLKAVLAVKADHASPMPSSTKGRVLWEETY